MYTSLVKAAKEAAAGSYSPYSGFCVGAALLAESGEIYTGCNIENSSFSVTVCAERTALFKAVSKGERGFAAIAVVGGRLGDFSDFCYPCGACRQVLSEFCGSDFKIILGKNTAEYTEHTLGELLPGAFSLDGINL